MNKKIEAYFKNPAKLVVFLQNRCRFRVLPDKPYLKLRYKMAMGKELDLKNPRTFNEKLQWLKLYDRKPEYTRMVDKYEAKKYVAQRIGEEYIIPTLGVWDRFDDIDFESLPDQFVLKCTHDSGGLVIVRDKSALDKAAARKKIENCLKKNYYLSRREWPYKNVKPRIIAEQFMGEELLDYKLFCFHGEARITLVCSERYSESGLCEDFFDSDWNHLELYRPGHGQAKEKIPKPVLFEEMKKLSTVLAGNIPFIRVDFYEIDGKLYFGEATFFPASGMKPFAPEVWDTTIGQWLNLPRGNGEK